MTSPSLLILGTDAVLAAWPVTPVQLAHACLAAGYRSVVPASWGDEIVARRLLNAVEISNSPLVVCVCPLVSRRLDRSGDLGAFMVSSVAPPVAAAAYLRALYAPAGVRITFAGACPSGADAAIDAWLTPAELLADLAAKGISLADQPTEFDSVLPPDRRRHYSDPGGAPAPEALRGLVGAPELVELEARDFAIDLAQELLSSGKRLIDVAPALGCTCSGALAGAPVSAARARVRACEPPRAPSPVVDHDLGVDVDVVNVPAFDRDAPVAMPAQTSVQSSTASAHVTSVAGDARTTAVAGVNTFEPPPPESVRRRSPAGNNRAVLGTMPQTRSSGRQLPRAYVARRRSSPKGIRQSVVRRQVDIMGPNGNEQPARRWVWVAGAGTLILAAAALLLRLI